MLAFGATVMAVSEIVKQLFTQRSLVRALNQSTSCAAASNSSGTSTGKGFGAPSGGGQSVCARSRSAFDARQARLNCVQISPCVNDALSWREEVVTAAGDFEVVSVFPMPVVNLSSFTSFIDTPADLTQCLRGRHPLLIEAESTDGQEFWERHYPAVHAAAAAVVAAADTGKDSTSSSSCANQLDSSGPLCKLERHSRRLAWKSGPVFAFLVTCTEAQLRMLFDAFLTDRLVADDPLKFNLMLLVRLEGLPMNLIGGTVSEPSSPSFSTSSADANFFGGQSGTRHLRRRDVRRSSEPGVAVRRLESGSGGGGSRGVRSRLQDISEVGGSGGSGCVGSGSSVDDLLASASSLLRRNDSVISQEASNDQPPTDVDSAGTVTAANATTESSDRSSSSRGSKPPTISVLTSNTTSASAESLASTVRALVDPFETIVTTLPVAEVRRSDAAWTAGTRVLILPPGMPVEPEDAAVIAQRFLIESSGCLLVFVGEVDNGGSLCPDDVLGEAATAAAAGLALMQTAGGDGQGWTGFESPQACDGGGGGGGDGGRLCLVNAQSSESCVLRSALRFSGVRTLEAGVMCQLPKLQPFVFASFCGKSLESSLLQSAAAAAVSPPELEFAPGKRLLLQPLPEEASAVESTADGGLRLPVVTLDSPEAVAAYGDFDLTQYRQYLVADQLGTCMLYSPVMQSSWELIIGLLSKLPASSGLIIVSGTQLQARGRDQNVWLAPRGSAQFSAHLTLPNSSKLATRPSLIQHVVALSVVQGVKSVPGCQNLNLRIKWPNDIHVPGRGKVSGILVKATNTVKDTLSVAVGIGINVSNVSPGCSLASEFQTFGMPTPKSLTREVVTARVVTALEQNLRAFQFDDFKRMYMDNWMHSGQVVDAWLSGEEDSALTISCRITGIDEAGFLRVRDLKSGRCVSLHPDGNSFDMTRSLILPK